MKDINENFKTQLKKNRGNKEENINYYHQREEKILHPSDQKSVQLYLKKTSENKNKLLDI